MRRGWFIGLALFIVMAASGAQAQIDTGRACAPSLWQVGAWMQVADDAPHNLRDAPSLRGARVGGVSAEDIFQVSGAAVCADGYRWLPVVYVDQAGWLADAPTGSSWYRPLDGQPAADLPEEPAGCARPPDDYARFWVKPFAQLNLRTLAMLDRAQQIYSADGGLIRLRAAVMQGSYNAGYVAASFGTHDGGGAVDLSVRDLQTRMVMDEEIEPLLMALRTAGFAAWLRAENELYAGSVIHIHAIAVGDAELSAEAQAQIDGPQGYLRGFNGLPEGWGGPAPDTLPLVLCAWMPQPLTAVG